MGSAAVAVNGSVVSGVVRTGGREYEIRSVGGGRHTIREVDRSGLPEGAPPLRPRSALEDPNPRALTDDPGRVDIAVFYTRTARRDAGGTDEIHALIDAWIADTNGAYLRSGILHRLNSVLREQVTYTEAEYDEEWEDSEDRLDSITGLAIDCLRKEDDDCMDGVHDRREEYSADLVHLLIGGPIPPKFCGRAEIVGSYGVTHLLCSGSAGFAHEVGHNSGANHDRYVEYDEECDTDSETPCFNDIPSAYAYGYVNQHGLDLGEAAERRWRTLMSYSNQCSDEGVWCRQLMRFSNPDQSWYGDELGVHGTRGLSSYRSAADAARRGPADATPDAQRICPLPGQQDFPRGSRSDREGAPLEPAPSGATDDSAPERRGPQPGDRHYRRSGHGGYVVPGAAERMWFIGRRADSGAATGVERASCGIDDCRTSFVAWHVLLPGVRVVRNWRDADGEQLLGDGRY